jgi:pyridoxal/pyridoxine/pyridoxamine kinase
MVNYIENFYNLRQRLSSINYLTPNEFEQLHLTQTQTQTQTQTTTSAGSSANLAQPSQAPVQTPAAPVAVSGGS